VVIGGPVAFDRYDDNTKFKFTITDPNGSVATILADVATDSLSYDWLQSLVRARRAAIRIADTRDMVPGTANPGGKHIALCATQKPEKRMDRMFFGLDCVTFDEKKLNANDRGAPWLDLIIVVSTAKGSFTDTFLDKRHEKAVIYVRLEETGR
jgi:hypothetical protein